MVLSRRGLLGTAGAALPALALAPASAARPRPADLATAEGWLAWIAAHREHIALNLDDGAGTRLRHRDHASQPLASAVKVIHLAAYGEAVDDRRLDRKERVRVGDWERFYVPTDGGAHRAALNRLRVPTDATGLYAANPDHRVELDQMVGVMIEFSDSAVPDYLRQRLGADDLYRAAGAGGWFAADIRSLCGEYLLPILPEQAPPPDAPVPQRQAVGLRLEREYSTDPRLRREVLDRLLKRFPPYDTQLRWASGTAAATAPQLAAMHHRLATSPRPGTWIARRHLERPLRDRLPPGAVGMGFKGGSLPGVLTGGMSLRRTDGSVAAGSLLVHGGVSPDQITSADPVLALWLALDDPTWRDRLARALDG